MYELPPTLQGHHAFVLREVLAGVDDAVLIFGRDHRVVYANESAHEIFKQKGSALLKKTITSLAPAEERGRFRRLLETLDASEDVGMDLHGKTEFIGQQSGGHTFYAEGRVAKIGGDLTYVLVLQDITWKRTLESELERVLLHLQKVGKKAKERLENPAILKQFPLD